MDHHSGSSILENLNNSFSAILDEALEVETAFNQPQCDAAKSHPYQVINAANTDSSTLPSGFSKSQASLLNSRQNELSSISCESALVQGGQLTAPHQVDVKDYCIAAPLVRQHIQQPGLYHHAGVSLPPHPPQLFYHHPAGVTGGHYPPNLHTSSNLYTPPPTPTAPQPSPAQISIESQLRRLIYQQPPLSDSALEISKFALQLRNFYHYRLIQLSHQSSHALQNARISFAPLQQPHLPQLFTAIYNQNRTALENQVAHHLQLLNAAYNGNFNPAITALQKVLPATTDQPSHAPSAPTNTVAPSPQLPTKHQLSSERKGDAMSGVSQPDKSVLKEWHDAHKESPYPTSLEMEQLSRTSGLPVAGVKKWFCNHRYRYSNTRTFDQIMQLRRKAKRADNSRKN